SNQTATHVELRGNGLRTGVQFPPAPPKTLTKASKDDNLEAFFIVKTIAYRLKGDKGFCGLAG
ncbi:MAG: hypothetical protein RLZZ399_3017, partial [Verrucomicrobiota bacterium]